MTQPLLDGLKVIDLASFIAGPVAATMLADFGADVIKVEPKHGDMLRYLSHIPTTPDAPTDYFWDMDGRNKRSITLNLKHPAGMEVMRKLIAEADVLVTNLPLPSRERLKLRYEDLKPLNPRLIYASLTAYGEAGPDARGKGFDVTAYWMRSGLMDLVRAPGAPPAQAVPGMGDHPTAVALFASIMTALLHRERTGEGSMAHTSLLANGLWSASSIVQGALAGGDLNAFDQRRNAQAVLAHPYETQDGRHLLFGAQTDYDVAAIGGVIGFEEILADPKYAEPMPASERHRRLIQDIDARTKSRTAEDWLALFLAAGAPVGLVPNVADAAADPQIQANGFAAPPADDAVATPLVVNPPVNVAGLPRPGARKAPELGEHTQDVLAELGLSAEEIRALWEQGAV
ncbi:MAG: CoA transferase [Pseudomonadota bacterium]